jgi:hypothetical protein
MDVCGPALVERLGPRCADLVVSMETIEHLEDYPAFIGNIATLLRPGGSAVIGTPNRTMTYNRYPRRRHMDESHVQEFTVPALRSALERSFPEVSLWYQWLPGYFTSSPPRTVPEQRESRVSGRVRTAAASLVPPAVGSLRRRVSRLSGTSTSRTWAESDVRFSPVTESSDLACDAFAIVAVCRRPSAEHLGSVAASV